MQFDLAQVFEVAYEYSSMTDATRPFHHSPEQIPAILSTDLLLGRAGTLCKLTFVADP